MSDNINKCMLRVGTVLHGTYRIEGYLSSGGFGNTYVAMNVAFSERYAIKEFFMKGISQRDGNNTTVRVSNAENKSIFAAQKEKFKKEARRLRMLHSEHIVKVYDLFEENGTAYYVMDCIDGMNLGNKLGLLGRPMPEGAVLKILSQVLDALATAHNYCDGDKKGILHLDLKPANLMLDKQGVVKLIDFGASKQQSASGGATTSSTICYTKGYAPREQMEQNLGKFGPWTDFYALGATLYNLLTNKRPPQPSDIDDDDTPDKHVVLPIPPSVSDKTKKLVLWLMATNRKKRPQSVEDIYDYLVATKVNDEDDTLVVGGKDTSNHYSTEHLSDETIIVNGVSFVMKGLQGGVFTMGATSEQCREAYNDEKPKHRVAISSFRIGQMEVTQGLWQAVMGSNPSNFKGDNRPVENVSWDDCQTFTRKLNQMTGKHFRLPTEAEWEYAARGGNRCNGYKYAGSNSLGNVAWYTDNSGNATHDVGTKQPNEIGLYDMSGNVYEWCQDWCESYSSSSQTTPPGASSGYCRVCRGGSWCDYSRDCRVSYRSRCLPSGRYNNLGLRLVL